MQDAASQVAALLSGAAPGETVADICAGAGGKTLALAAMMQNQGRLVAHDTDRFRLRPIFERLQRAGVTNCEVISAQDQGKLEAAAPFDCVVIDAPCSGSGAWRRKPDAKWRLTETQLDKRSRISAKSLKRDSDWSAPADAWSTLHAPCWRRRTPPRWQISCSAIPAAGSFRTRINGAARSAANRLSLPMVRRTPC